MLKKNHGRCADRVPMNLFFSDQGPGFLSWDCDFFSTSGINCGSWGEILALGDMDCPRVVLRFFC